MQKAACLLFLVAEAACSSSPAHGVDDMHSVGSGDLSAAVNDMNGTAGDLGLTGDGPSLAGDASDAAMQVSSKTRQSWAWVYTSWTASAATIVAHASSFTHISPTFYDLNYDYTSGVAEYWNCSSKTPSCNYEGKTPAQYTAQLTAVGLKVVPAIYAGSANGGTDQGVQNILDDKNGAAESFISSMVTEAVTQGYSGYNLDWELGSTGSAYADKLVTFVNSFKTALAPHGLTLSVDAIDSNINGTWCSSNDGYLDLPKLATSSVDAIIIEDYTASLGTASTSCQSAVLSSANPIACPLNSSSTDVTFTGLLDFMCSNLPTDKVVIGMQSDSTNTNGIAGNAISAIESYGFQAIAVWPQVETNDFMSAQGLVAPETSWLGILSDFLAH